MCTGARPVVKFVLCLTFTVSVGLAAAENKMSFANLSTVLTPTLFQSVDLSSTGPNNAMEALFRTWPAVEAVLNEYGSV